METLMIIATKILNFLNGKKSVIVGIIMTTVGYLALKGYIGNDEFIFIGTLTTLLFGSASVATGYIGGNPKMETPTP